MKYKKDEAIRACVNLTGLDGKLRISIGTKYKIIQVFDSGGILIIDDGGHQFAIQEYRLEVFFGTKTNPYDYAMGIV